MFVIIVWPTRAFQANEGTNVKLAVKSGALIPALLMLPNVAWMLVYNLNAVLQVSVPLALAAVDKNRRDGHMCQTIVTGRVSKVDHSFATVSSVLFDAVYVPGGARAEVLCRNADAVRFVKEAYKHRKAIAASGDAAFSKRFADAVAQHPFPERADINAIVA